MALENREKYLIAAAAVLAVFFIFYQYLFIPYTNKNQLLENQIIDREKDVLRMMELKAEYIDLLNKKEKIYDNLNKKEDFAIFSYLEKLAIDAKLKGKITYMKPITSSSGNKVYKENSVEVRMEGVTLDNLIFFLYNIEHQNKSVKITQLFIKPKERDSSQLDVNFLVSSIYLNKKSS